MNKDFVRTLILRAAIGFALGEFVGIMLTTLLCQNDFADGRLYVCSPELTAFVGDPIQALLIELILSGLLGAVCCGLTFVYDIEDWSLLKATFVHYLVSMTMYFCTAFFLRWLMPGDVKGNMVWFLLMTGAYACIWFGNYIAYKIEISKINRELEAWKKKES